MSEYNFVKSALIASGLTVSTIFSANADTVKHQTQFSVRFAGLEIGVANFNIQFGKRGHFFGVYKIGAMHS